MDTRTFLYVPHEDVMLPPGPHRTLDRIPGSRDAGPIPTCPACGRSLALGDRHGRHVASEAHYPRLAASGAMVCSPPAGDVVQLGLRGGSRPVLRLVDDQP